MEGKDLEATVKTPVGVQATSRANAMRKRVTALAATTLHANH